MITVENKSNEIAGTRGWGGHSNGRMPTHVEFRRARALFFEMGQTEDTSAQPPVQSGAGIPGRIEQMYWLPRRGVIVTLPPHVTREIAGPISRWEDITPAAGHRLALLDKESILKKRFPNSEIGNDYRNRVDMVWRGALLHEAMYMAYAIKEAVKQVTGFAEEEFAILLFGSIARGLSRSRQDADPSNLDITVIANFTEDQREQVFYIIRPNRERGRERIRNNIGVCLQTPSKFTNDHYALTLELIGSCAQPLHDPGNLWGQLEQEALEYSLTKTRKKMAADYTKNPRQEGAHQFSKSTRV